MRSSLTNATASEASSARIAGPAQNPQQVINEHYYKMKVYPNPARDFATFEWDFVEVDQRFVINISSVTGQTVETVVIEEIRGHWLWDTRELPAGIYFYKLTGEDGKLIRTGNIVLEK